MVKDRNTDPHVEQIEASGNNDGTGWSGAWRQDNVFVIVTRFRTRPIGTIPDDGRKLLVGDQLDKQSFYIIRLFQSSTCF